MLLLLFNLKIKRNKEIAGIERNIGQKQPNKPRLKQTKSKTENETT